jgi:phage-related protein
VASHEGNAYRAIYTVKFAKAVFVLHAFQKKSTRGIKTSKADIELVKRRLRIAHEQYRRLYEGRRDEQEEPD